MDRRVFNADKTQELTEYDLALGYLAEDKLVTVHHDAVVGKTADENAAELQTAGETVEHVNGEWYHVLKVYPNGGKESVTIYPTEAKEAYDEYEDIYVYIPYTEAELAAIEYRSEIAKAKAYLQETDYIVLKIAEATAEGDAAGVAALQEEYAVQLEKRKEARAAVKANEASLMNL